VGLHKDKVRTSVRFPAESDLLIVPLRSEKPSFSTAMQKWVEFSAHAAAKGGARTKQPACFATSGVLSF
jgi:hypothetical protein